MKHILVSSLWNNKNEDIEVSAIDAFLEQYSSGGLIIKLLENQIIKK